MAPKIESTEPIGPGKTVIAVSKSFSIGITVPKICCHKAESVRRLSPKSKNWLNFSIMAFTVGIFSRMV